MRHVGLEIRSLSIAIRRHIDAKCIDITDAQLTGIQGMVLGYICRQHSRGIETYQRDLEARFDFKRSTASNILQLLEKSGYITRVTSESDARLKRIILTPKAIDFGNRMKSEMDSVENGIDSLLTDEERELFFGLSDRIKAALTDTNGGNYDKKTC